jgi:hypothetical protein
MNRETDSEGSERRVWWPSRSVDTLRGPAESPGPEAVPLLHRTANGKREGKAQEPLGGWPFFIVTHRPQDEPERAGFTFVNGLAEQVERTRRRTWSQA